VVPFLAPLKTTSKTHSLTCLVQPGRERRQ